MEFMRVDLGLVGIGVICSRRGIVTGCNMLRVRDEVDVGMGMRMKGEMSFKIFFSSNSSP